MCETAPNIPSLCYWDRCSAFIVRFCVEQKIKLHCRKCAPGGDGGVLQSAANFVIERLPVAALPLLRLLCAGAHNSNPPQPASLLPFLLIT